MEIEIEYCVPCGLLNAAERVEHAVLSRFGERIDVLRMKPGHGGVFRVSVDGTVIFDKTHDGFDLDMLLERVGAQPVAAPRHR